MIFKHIDLSLPQALLPSKADMTFCRDALQHLSYNAIAGVFSTFCRSEATYLMVGSYLESEYNTNIDSGRQYFSINLLEPPFSFNNPIDFFLRFS